MYVTKDLECSCNEQEKKASKIHLNIQFVVYVFGDIRFTFALHFISLLFQIFLFKKKNYNPTHINKIGENIIIWIKHKINHVATSLNCLGLK